MTFFQSELVSGDIQEMMELQQFCFRSVMNFPILSTERKLEYVDALKKLIEKQKIFYFRLKLSDHLEAKSALETLKQGVVMLGATPGTDVEEMFNELLERVEFMRTSLQSGTEG